MKKFLFSGIIACLIGFCLSCTTTEDSVGLQMRAGLPNFNLLLSAKTQKGINIPPEAL